MKQFELKSLGLEEMTTSELQTNGGGIKDVVKKVAKNTTVIAVWEWVNEHWDALKEGFERGCEEGAELYDC